ncbi:MAG: hypothetical protein OCU22_03760 [Canidatus Methanoxibalbensis ujae]|nr:hypothetical protein [Candidatus Methanoxibalbensis ujae]
MQKLRISREKRIYKKARDLQKRIESEIQTISISHLKQKLGEMLRKLDKILKKGI